MVSDFNIYVWNWSKIAKPKKIVFFADFALQNMVETTLPDGLETSGRRAYRKFQHISRHFIVFAFLMIFRFFKKIGFWVFLVHPTVVSVLLSASIERCFVSCMQDFFQKKSPTVSMKSRISGTGIHLNSLILLWLLAQKEYIDNGGFMFWDLLLN